MFDWTAIIIFWVFCGAAARDWFTGRVPLALIGIPVVMLGLWFPGAFLAIFWPVFLVLLGIFGVVMLLQHRFNMLPRDKVYFGLADVLMIPLAIALSEAVLPVLGPAAFAAVFSLELPLFLKNHFRRLLPWLVPPTATALLLGILL